MTYLPSERARTFRFCVDGPLASPDAALANKSYLKRHARAPAQEQLPDGNFVPADHRSHWLRRRERRDVARTIHTAHQRT
ncbi:hypothetical protein [Streptomyces decoyicus]|uniref:hypothetical protein n=1 Tax=Streptomyces decoyicus TaxID=249567 RepID=UPI0038655054